MANVFISHRKIDSGEAEKLALEIKKAGHDVWFDDWNINIGDSIVERVTQGLTGSNRLILCCSSSGMSDWVDREWMSTLARQLTGHGVRVLPILLTGGSLPALLADFKFADLVTDWDRGVKALIKSIQMP